ncbi:alpha/beta hydrolase [Winogradskyella eckloniae]|uniref:alpha/beta hydrolase n=1 Tax=Winogradskyella eckloniae TaxID=1089306 RepID=UPI001563E7E3|nr:alpha/beta hydrolase [Winogradskyella eckloniae]NRD21013.1 alpha/beta hydrolase [Winogradskyella eckloniae]
MKFNALTTSFIFAFCCIVSAQQKEYKPVQFPNEYTSQIDVVYKTVDEWEGRIDLYSNQNASTPTPILLNIHGGGWNHGEKESQSGFGSFFKNGYAVANVEYRLVDVAPAPAAIEDVRCALIYIYNNAKALNIDTNKIVIMGGSAGGHLALMAGLLGNNSIYDANCTYKGELKVAAIINKYGVTDLVPLKTWKSAKRWLGAQYLNTEFTQSVSPLYYVTKDSPPIFIVHGDADPIVPYSQSVKLYDALVKHKVVTEFLSIPNGKHGKFKNEDKKLFKTKMWQFLKTLNLSNL